MAQIETINKEKFNSFFNEDIESDNEQLERLLDIFQQQYQDFERVCKAGKHEDLKNACHRLKSSCHSFGASALLQEMESLELAAKEKREVKELMEKSLSVYLQTIEELNEMLKRIKEDS